MVIFLYTIMNISTCSACVHNSLMMLASGLLHGYTLVAVARETIATSAHPEARKQAMRQVPSNCVNTCV